jgi:hypothetical protein
MMKQNNIFISVIPAQAGIQPNKIFFTKCFEVKYLV